MEIITNSFNKKGKCPDCSSTFFYNLNDIEKIQMESSIVKEKAEKISAQSDLELGKWIQTPGQMIKCPCCSKPIIIKNPSIYFFRKDKEVI